MLTSETGNNMTSAGYTLMELLVVLAVLGLLTVFSAPALMGLLPSYIVNAQARTLASALRDARIMAILNNDEIIFSIDSNQESYGLDNNKTLTRVSSGIDLQIYPALNSNQKLIFFPDGTSTGAHIDLVKSDHKRTLIVEKLSGDVSIIN